MCNSGLSTYSSNELRVLALLAQSRDAEAIPRVLAASGAASVMCSTLEKLCAEISKGAGAILIEEEVIHDLSILCLRTMLESQPTWSELPIIALLRRGPETKAAREALLLPGDVTLVERPVRVNTLVTVVRSALASRRRQYLVRDQLQALEKTAGSLRVTETELRTAKDELEIRVQERTRELTQALEDLKNETETRIHAVDELRGKELLLIQQSRMAAMGEMIGFIAHQWRQPLNILGLVVQEVSLSYSMGTMTQEQIDDSTDRAMQLIASMSRTIEDFMGFFKSEKRKVAFSLNEIVQKTIKLVDANFRQMNLAIEVFAQQEVLAEGYPNEYSQVILNILLNARDALLERAVPHPRLLISIFRENGRSVMTIADNAGGIPEGIMERVFESYFTTKGPEKGTGIGLYMAKLIIEKNMNGRLSLRNTDIGAEFRIEV